MQMTRIFVFAAIVYCLSICGAVAQNHQALAVRELGARSSSDQLPPTQNCPTGPQNLASNPIAVNAEYLEKLNGELEDLLFEKEKVKQSQDKDKGKRLIGLGKSINHQQRKIQGAEMGLSTVPKRLLYANHRDNSNRRSITQLEDRVGKLQQQRDRAQGTERARLSSPRKTHAENSARTRSSGSGKFVWGVDFDHTEKDGREARKETCRAGEDEQDPDQLKKLKNNFSCIRSRMRKAQKKKTQQSHEPHNGNAKADESRVGQTSEGAHMTENSDSNGVQLPGAGLEADQELNFMDRDTDLGVSDCSGNNFDNDILSMSDEEFRKWFETMEEVQH
ncbi:hypothetical protein H0H93_005105 [Arthromyces matolae]|nr:hypothetical protein H0H93_005105 [Arthromyces matolae]